MTQLRPNRSRGGGVVEPMQIQGRRSLIVIASALLIGSCTTQPGPATPTAPSPTISSPSIRIGAPRELADARVVFVREHGVFQAYADGTDEQRLIDLRGLFEYQPDWSPDGRWLALRVDDERIGGTILVSSDGKRVDYLTRELGFMGGSADWAPGSRQLVLTGRQPKDQSFGLYIVDVVRRTATRITPPRYEAQYPAWSPDGDLIAFTRVHPSTNDFDIWTIAPDGTGAMQLTDGPDAENYSAWSPDGTQLAYYSEANDSIWVMDSDGSSAHSVARGGEPQWEPGEFIIFECLLGEGSPGQSCVVRPDGSALSRLPLGEEAMFPNWAPKPSVPVGLDLTVCFVLVRDQCGIMSLMLLQRGPSRDEAVSGLNQDNAMSFARGLPDERITN
jgi:WD40-like Beta Propeller Repeat